MTEERFRVNIAEETEEEIRRRRRRLRAALDQVEHAIAAAAGAPREWQEQVTGSLERLRTTWTDHITKTEAENGFYAQILQDAPRLEATVNRVRGEHEGLVTTTEKLLARCQEGALEADAIEELRLEILDLLGRSARHRQHGSDLIYEAYQVDISVGD